MRKRNRTITIRCTDDEYERIHNKAQRYKLSLSDFVLGEDNIEAYDSAGNLLATAAVSSEYLDFVYLNDSVYFLGLHEINKIAFET